MKKGVSTKKKTSVNVAELLALLQFIPQETQEQSLLSRIAEGMPVETMVLLQNNDRVALFSWLESADAKSVFTALKQAQQEQFSPQLEDLVDETRTSEDGPPVDFLSFTDPAISPEKVIFVRVRNRLYEFHVAGMGSETIDRLIEELSK